jgi:rubrerythrin
MRYVRALFLVAALLFPANLLVAGEKAAAAKTVENLKAAFAGETTASRKYAAYAARAKEEGYVQIALLFEAASKAESVHAANHRTVVEQMGSTMDSVTAKYEVKSTKENLKDAVTGESYEASTMYPAFMKVASAGKSSAAMLSFNYAYKTEQKHKELYSRALSALKENRVSSLPGKYFVCTTCGNTYDNEAAARCGICMTPKERFVAFQ